MPCFPTPSSTLCLACSSHRRAWLQPKEACRQGWLGLEGRVRGSMPTAPTAACWALMGCCPDSSPFLNRLSNSSKPPCSRSRPQPPSRTAGSGSASPAVAPHLQKLVRLVGALGKAAMAATPLPLQLQQARSSALLCRPSSSCSHRSSSTATQQRRRASSRGEKGCWKGHLTRLRTSQLSPPNKLRRALLHQAPAQRSMPQVQMLCAQGVWGCCK
mmetsp:Transcript_17589/g.49058  ORF Transcript_17589/g.49058 Transcript_17589/m.49058 type:complete len:215 (-) Transcript_17589:143-787(-)